MKTRRRFTGEFEAKGALEALQGQRMIAELATRHELHPNVITQWRRQAIEKLARVFDDKGLEVQANRDAQVTKPLAEHLARHAEPISSSILFPATPASDALWAGLPVLTCQGRAFGGRVAASLLNAIGPPDLVTTSLQDYEALALRLATDRPLFAEVRARLDRNQPTFPLFDTPRFCRNIESAYAAMWDRHQRGERPESFAVEES